jgi:hypothetical protein
MPEMKIEDFRDEIIRRAIVSVNQHEDREYRRRGCLEGLRIAGTMLAIGEFQDEIQKRNEIEYAIRSEGREEEIADREKQIEKFWEFRCATAQLEFVLDRLKVAYYTMGLYSGPLSGRAVQQYSEIVGVKERV